MPLDDIFLDETARRREGHIRTITTCPSDRAVGQTIHLSTNEWAAASGTAGAPQSPFRWIVAENNETRYAESLAKAMAIGPCRGTYTI